MFDVVREILRGRFVAGTEYCFDLDLVAEFVATTHLAAHGRWVAFVGMHGSISGFEGEAERVGSEESP